MDPRDPKTDRRVAEVKGGGWNRDFTPDSLAVVMEYVSITKSNLRLLNVASGALTPIGDHRKEVAYGGAEFAPTARSGSRQMKDPNSSGWGPSMLRRGKFTPIAPDAKWDVEGFEIAKDGSFVAYVVNEAGIARVKVLDPRSRAVRTVSALPAGSIGGFTIAPWGDLAFSLTSARSATDVYSVNPQTLAVTRWTTSETGGLDATKNVEPELIEVKSFDGKSVSGFLYRPDAREVSRKAPADLQYPRRT